MPGQQVQRREAGAAEERGGRGQQVQRREAGAASLTTVPRAPRVEERAPNRSPVTRTRNVQQPFLLQYQANGQRWAGFLISLPYSNPAPEGILDSEHLLTRQIPRPIAWSTGAEERGGRGSLRFSPVGPARCQAAERQCEEQPYKCSHSFAVWQRGSFFVATHGSPEVHDSPRSWDKQGSWPKA